MKIIADSSILIHMATIGRFHLLKELFEEIVIPESVYEEVVIEGWGSSGSLETSEATKQNHIIMKKATDKEKVKELSEKYKVSVANAEVIQLANELNADLILADEEEVRTGAEEGGFRIKGCLGILIDAVKSKIIPARQAIGDIEKLVASGYRIRDDIVKKVKELLKEDR